MFLDGDKWPTFEEVWCRSLADVDPKYTLCFKVEYPGDEHHDYMLLEHMEDMFKTYRGIMKEEPITVVYNEPDQEYDGDTRAAVLCLKIFLLHIRIITK